MMIDHPNLVVVDLAPHPETAWAVILRGQLLPIRFASKAEALDHLFALEGRMATAEARLNEVAA